MTYIYTAVAFLVMLLALGFCMEYNLAHDWQNKYNALQTSYRTAAVSAITHAQAVEAKQDAAIKTQTDNALSQASAATSKANTSKAVYDAKLAAIAKQKPTDLPHICANVLIPADLK